jgi:hypothetical protein
VTQTPERQEYLKNYRARKKAEYAAKKAERNRKVEAEQANIGRTAGLADETPSPPPSATSGKVEDKGALLDEFLGAVGPKINPRPINPDEKDKEGEGTTGEVGAPPLAVPPALWQFADARLRKMFAKEIAENPDMAPTALDHESAKYMSEALSEGMAHSKMTMNPWYGFAIIMLLWALPYIMLAWQKFAGPKKKKDVKQNGEGKPASDWGLRPNRIFGTKPPPIDKLVQYLGEPESIPREPEPGAVVATAADIAARDDKLGVAHVDSGASEDGKDNPGG